RDDLALLGQPQAAADAAGRLREDRVVARAAAAADRAAAAVEEAQSHAVRCAGIDERPLRPVDRPARRQIAAVLVAVGIAEHYFLPVAAGCNERAVERQREGRA